MEALLFAQRKAEANLSLSRSCTPANDMHWLDRLAYAVACANDEIATRR